jgi:hypothetical protein
MGDSTGHTVGVDKVEAWMSSCGLSVVRRLSLGENHISIARCECESANVCSRREMSRSQLTAHGNLVLKYAVMLCC